VLFRSSAPSGTGRYASSRRPCCGDRRRRTRQRRVPSASCSHSARRARSRPSRGPRRTRTSPMSADTPLELDLAKVLIREFPADTADEIERASAAESAALLAETERTAIVEVMRRVTPDQAARILEKLPNDVLRGICADLAPPRTAAMLARLDASARARVVATIDAGLAREIEALTR